MDNRCKETVYTGKDAPHQCTRKSVKDGWCKQHWQHPFYAIWFDKIEAMMETLPKCTCPWGDVVSPSMSDEMPEGADESHIGECSLSCIDCDAETPTMPVGSEEELAALGEAWCAVVAAQKVVANG